MAEVAAEDSPAAPSFQRQEQVAGAAADVQNQGAGPVQDGAEAAHGAGAPVAVDVEREEVVEKIVAAGDASEHPAHPLCGLLFARGARSLGALGARAVHPRASSMAQRTTASSIPGTTLTSPMRSGKTQRTWPLRVFLSITARATSAPADTPVSGGMGP